jgi:IS30 family transposase
VTQEERCQIYAFKSTGMTLRAIAQELGRAHSTIVRELKRNSGKRGYRFKQAQRIAASRRQAVSRAPTKMTPIFIKLIEERLARQWSPEQIAGRLSREGSLISHETIYKHVWADKKSGGTLYKNLRHRAKPYNKRSAGHAGRGHIPGRVDISERPIMVESKSRIGDWEGDTIIGAQHKGAIVSYVDRLSKFTLLQKVERKTAAAITAATLLKMTDLPHPVRTITYDNGKEFSAHQEVAKALNTKCYFARPYHSWERGLNEHTNGLVRQYLPKSNTFSKIADSVITFIENRLNNRPRKSLQYRTPFEVFYGDSRLTPSGALRT